MIMGEQLRRTTINEFVHGLGSCLQRQGIGMCLTDMERLKNNGRLGLDERGARRTTHLIEATYVAYGDARTRVKHMKTKDLGIQRGGPSRGTSMLYLVCHHHQERSGRLCRVYAHVWRHTRGRQNRERQQQKAVKGEERTVSSAG